MEPNSLYHPEGGAETPQPASHSRKKLFIIVGALVLVVIAAILFAVFTGKKSGSPKKVNTGDTSLYYDREGYDRNKLRPDVGDPMALTMAAKQGAQELTSGTVVIPACAVLTPDNLKSAGFKLYPNGFGFPVIQNYLSESGKAKFAPDRNNMPLDSDTISCNYGLMSSKSDLQSVNIAVNQPFTVDENIVAGYLTQRGYVAQAAVNGYQVFKRDPKSDTDRLSYMLRKDGNSIELDLQLDDTNKAGDLVKTATSNLNKLKSDPRNVSEVSYNSPVFKQSYARSCDFVDNDDVKQLAGVDASPLVKAYWPTAISIADFSSISDYKTKTNYLRNQCVHTANDPQYKTLVGTTHHSVEVLATTYEADEAAGNGLLYISIGKYNDSKQKVSGVGEEAYVFKKGGQNTLAFRQGRVVIELTYDGGKQSGDFADSSSYAQRLSPLGAKIANKLTSL